MAALFPQIKARGPDPFRYAAQASALAPPEVFEMFPWRLPYGDHAQARKGEGRDFFQMRPYVSGDPRIDWKASAKSDLLMTRDYTRENDLLLRFLCETSKAMAYRSDPSFPTRGEFARCINLSLAQAALMKGAQIGTARQALGRSEAALPSLYETVADDLIPPKQSCLIHCGAFLDDPATLFQTWESFDPEQIWIIQILDPAEIDLPFEGPAYVHEMPPSSPARLIGDFTSLRNEYRAGLTHHVQALAHGAKKRGWQFSCLRSTTEPDSLFAQLLRPIEGLP